jgi:DMSO/TMAO reductase YedYZ molybdopterin-dependent catalytic subunit
LISSGRRAFLVGVLAGAVALSLSYLLRLFVGGVFLPELASQTLFAITPGQIESGAVTNLGPLAKYSAVTGAIIVNLVLYGALATLLFRNYQRFSGRSNSVKLYAFSLIACAVMAALAMLFLGVTQGLSQLTLLPLVVVYLLPPNIAYGIVLSSLQTRVVPLQTTECKAVDSMKTGYSRKRRLIIKSGIAAVVAGTILAYGLELLLPQSQASVPASISSIYTQEVTPNDKFYRVDVNVIVPEVNANQWTLSVSGLVDKPLTMTYNDFTALAVVEQYNTLECVSSRIGDNLISTAKWKGPRLKDILARAGIKQDAKYIVFKCADGYDVGIPIDRGLLDGTLLAYEMNGVPLPKEHGYPLRAVVPGLYGMMNAKWITEVDAVNNVYEGYWQRRGWANNAEYHTSSSIVIPGASDVDRRFDIAGTSTVLLAGNLPIAGIAFAGDRGVEKVEVSTDGGATWSQASLKDPLSQYTWVLWYAQWNPPSAGDYKIAVRATDKTGAVQTAEISDSFPKGATGYHIVDIKVLRNSQ